MRASPAGSHRRWLSAVLLTEIAVIHLSLIPQHLREAPYAGALFIALSAGALLTAALLVVRDDRLAWVAASLLAGGALVAYALSRSIGLPSLHDDVGDWLNPLGGGAVVAEALTLALSAGVLVGMRRERLQESTGTRSVPPVAIGSA